MTSSGDHPYHHGNLRRALLDEALKAIRDEGVDAITLREVARRVGVTHAAPYHHFPDKASLIAALGQEGLAMLDDAMDLAEQQAGADPAARLEAIGEAYVLFAASHPDYFAVMFRPEPCLTDGEPPRGPAEGGAWRHLVDAIVACQQAGLAPAGDPLPLAINAWSLVHGLASLWVFGTLNYAPPEMGGIEGLATMVVGQSVRSLAAMARETKE